LYAWAAIQHIAVHISISLAVSPFTQDTLHLRLFQGVQHEEANVEQDVMINRPSVVESEPPQKDVFEIIALTDTLDGEVHRTTAAPHQNERHVADNARE
jgi:hypothetical protein